MAGKSEFIARPQPSLLLREKNVFLLLWQYRRLDECERHQGTTSRISASPRPAGEDLGEGECLNKFCSKNSGQVAVCKDHRRGKPERVCWQANGVQRTARPTTHVKILWESIPCLPVFCVKRFSTPPDSMTRPAMPKPGGHSAARRYGNGRNLTFPSAPFALESPQAQH